MRKFFKYMVGLTLIAAVLASCEYRSAEQDVAPTVSPDGYPVATFTTDFSGSEIDEGDTIAYTITFDKAIDRSVTFHFTQTDGDAELHADFDETPAVVQPYTTEAEGMLVVYADDDPEDAETLSIEVGATSLADKYLINPSVVNPTHALTVNNVNDPTLLTVKFEWDSDLDYDIVSSSGFSNGDTLSAWGTGGATGANPEFDMAIWLADPPGTYFVSLIEWGEGVVFDYVMTLGLPDGTNQIIEGTWDPATADDDYTVDVWDRWGNPPAYRLLEVEVDGSDAFTITVL